MKDLKLARALLKAAYRDLKALNAMLDSNVFAEEIFGFHVQQAAEKSIKAWLSALGDVFPFTHDLNILLTRLEGFECDVSPFRELLLFNSFAVELRYEVLTGDTEPINRTEAIALVKALYQQANEFVTNQILS
ncbi:MAG: HEPN domain-containing protein [Cyanobacteria bacterium P01_A01_bin.137]